MIVTLIYKDDLTELILPKKIEGSYNINIPNIKDSISIESDDDYWVIYKSKKYKLLDNDENELNELILKENTINLIEIDDEIGLIYIEEDNETRKIYEKYYLNNDAEITIGRKDDNTIIYKNKFISSNHAKLSYKDNKWIIKDNDSVNGTFVNNKLIDKKELSYGDVIYILGLKIIVFNNFIMVNNPNKMVYVKQDIFSEKTNEKIKRIEKKENTFYRSPRLKKDIETFILNIDSPPEQKSETKTPLLLTIGPSVTTGIVSLVFMAINPTISIISLIATILWPIISRAYNKSNVDTYEYTRQSRYKEYLNSIEDSIKNEKEKQKKILEENFVPIETLEKRIIAKDRSLWEREVFQDDFLKLRIGTGNQPLDIEKKYEEKKFTLAEDNLKEKLNKLGKEEEILENVPISVSFYDNYVSGVIGSSNEVKEFAKSLIIETSALYSYDEVKFIVIYKDKEFDFTKWLPHTFSNENDFRYIATNQDEIKEISYYLSEDIQNRIDNSNNNNNEEILPYYIVFNLDKDLAIRADFINNIYDKHTNLNFSIINFYNSIEELPKECSTIIELNKDKSRILTKNESSYDVIDFNANNQLKNNTMELAKKLANIKLIKKDANFELPTTISILDMYNVGKIEKLNILNRYKENDITKSLKAPVGVDKYGNTFYLDLHEKFHGPHGLVAGTTGSGKSEFIMTYILSLAINYSPEEVSFILIDYKGGGMAESFKKLPHVSGIITNIDKSAVNRAITSIHAELKRREKLINEAKEIVGESNIDIYKYQKYYREGELKEPLSHLFIISDEFAELKNQEPEFMDELISTARIGRSIGVHLILATQKPSGVVSDQIWSNSKFRVCLKVQDVADSQEMLKRPEAAYLKEVGRFYLQVGNNELFELGQSAYGGVDYYPKSRLTKEEVPEVNIVDNNLLSLYKTKMSNSTLKSEGKQLDVLVKYINSLCKDNKLKSRKIWQETMPDIILLDDIKKEYDIKEKEYYINPVIGLYDDLESQENKPLRIPITDKGNLLVYGSIAPDKNKFLTTLIYSCMTSYTSKELNTYILDFDSENLLMFKDLPTIADVILKDEEDKVESLIKSLIKEIESRKKSISKNHMNYKELIDSKDEDKLPNILVIINNFVVFRELYDKYDDDFVYIVRESYKYGIYLIATLSLENDMRYAISQNFAQSITLQLYDEANYYSIVGKTNITPSPYDGRGLVKIDKQVYEYQTATLTIDEKVSTFVAKKGKELSTKDNKIDNLVKTLPKQITKELLKEYKTKKLDIPIGINKETLEPSYLDIENNYISIVTGDNYKEYNDFKEAFIEFLSKTYKLDLEIINDSNSEEIRDRVFNETLTRNNEYKTALKENKKYKVPPKKIIIISNLREILDDLEKEKKDELEAVLEKGCTDYNLHIILFEESSKLNQLQARSWFKNVNRDNVLWVGDNFDDQYLFNYDKSFDSRTKLQNKYGILVKEGDVEVVKLLESGDSDE